MTFTSPKPAKPARHLVCLDLVVGELRPEDPARPAHFRLPVENGRRMLAFARGQGWSITHVHRRAPASETPRPVDGLQPLPSERVLYRSGISAFSNRTFRRTVQSDRGAELILLGFSLSAACLATALTAHDWNLPVTLVEDVFQPADGEGYGVDALQTVARAMAAPFVRIVSSETFTGPQPRLRLVAAE